MACLSASGESASCKVVFSACLHSEVEVTKVRVGEKTVDVMICEYCTEVDSNAFYK